MAKIIGVVGSKGGIGKTTICANIGGLLADMNQRILLIDGDYQQTLSSYYKIDPNHRSKYALTQFIQKADSTNCISKTNIENLDIIESDDPNARLAEWLRQSSHNVFYLSAAVKKLDNDYDYIIIDSQGAKGILQESIIFASDLLISPIIPDVLESREFMRGTINMLKDLEPPHGMLIPMPKIPPLYGVIYRQDRTRNAIKIANTIRRKFYEETKGKISILKTFVPMMSAYKKASGLYQPVHRVEVYRSGPTPSAYHIYLSLVYELLPHLSGITPDWLRTTNDGLQSPATVSHIKEAV